MMCPNFICLILQDLKDPKVSKSLINQGLLACLFDSNCNSNMSSGMTGGVTTYQESSSYVEASSIATATATVIPTMGLLPAPMRTVIRCEG